MKYEMGEDNTERITFRVDIDTMNMLRKLSYLTQKPVATFMREGVRKVLHENKKVLTNSKNVV